ncbi:hypothetical protein RZS08_26980, partial [Arthrospira platensis SPKY1]|nr:hypothetical protein [Arthrospira platensis SPKY1]
MFLDLHQGSHIGHSVSTNGHGPVVATMFPLGSHRRSDIPDGRIEVVEHFQKGLDHVDQVIVPPDMGQFVGQYSLR